MVVHIRVAILHAYMTMLNGPFYLSLLFSFSFEKLLFSCFNNFFFPP